MYKITNLKYEKYNLCLTLKLNMCLYNNIVTKLKVFDLELLVSKEALLADKRVVYKCKADHINDLALASFNNKTKPSLMNSLFSLCQTCQNLHVHEKEIRARLEELNFTLISFSYIDHGDRKVEYRCSCGNTSSTGWKNLKKSTRTTKCPKCQNDKNKVPYDTLCKTFIDGQCVLLTKAEEYVNNKCKLKYTCVCGNDAEIVYHDFVVGKRCGKCKVSRTCKTNMEKYGVSNPFQSEEIKERIKDTHVKTLGVEYPQQHPEVRAKTENTCLQKYGYKWAFVAPEVYTKIKKIFKDRYGVEYPLQCAEVLEKIKLVCQERYGADYFVQSDECKKKMMEKYGAEYFVQSDEAKRLMLEKYGAEYFVQSEEFKKTMIEKYGVEHAMQCPILFRKAAASSFKRKPYIFKDQTFMLLGYEDRAIDDILKEEDIDVMYAGECEQIPVFEYFIDDKKHLYYPDIYIPENNKIVEVKSVYTYNKDVEKVEYKAISVSEHYIFELRIYDSKNLIFVIEVYKGGVKIVKGDDFEFGKTL